jgi:allantoin racemase
VTEILLINPNTSAATTEMMVAIANSACPAGWSVRGVTAVRGASMIVSTGDLAMAVGEVIRIGQEEASQVAAIIIGAFADPGLEVLRSTVPVPVTGLCEAAMLEASAEQRRFGVATTTPELAAAIDGKAAALGLQDLYSGIRLTQGDPFAVTRDPNLRDKLLEVAVRECAEFDGARAVIIGGGPLALAAVRLASRVDVPIIAPIPAALRQLLRAYTFAERQ